jgi:hypothetical protein
VNPTHCALSLGAKVSGLFVLQIYELYYMAKAKKKSAKEASNIFHDIMKASVKDNPKSKKEKKGEKKK